jgi:hypothetical protein
VNFVAGKQRGARVGGPLNGFGSRIQSIS